VIIFGQRRSNESKVRTMIGICSDIHLDSCDDTTRASFENYVAQFKHLFILGDFGTSIEDLTQYLSGFADPFFLLGNHDYWGGTFKDVQASVEHLKYLPLVGPIRVRNRQIVGEDGIGDGHLGRVTTRFLMKGEILIKDLKYHPNPMMVRKEVSTQMVERLLNNLALCDMDDIYIFTHVPPFDHEYEGAPTETEKKPYYIWGQGGEAIEEWVAKHLSKRVHVISGHCHWYNHVVLSDRLQFTTLPAEYGSPTVQRVE